jgi:hypothetical protein
MQTSRRQMGPWRSRSPDDPRKMASYRNGAWILAPIGQDYICLPPNGSILSYGIFSAMVDEPMPDHGMIAMASIARRWMEAVYGEQLEHMLKPFNGEHDFTVLCGGIPIRLTTHQKNWKMSFAIGGKPYEFSHVFLEGLLIDLPEMFGAENTLGLSETRTKTFLREAATGAARAYYAREVGTRVKQLSRDNPDKLNSDEVIVQAMRRVQEMDDFEIFSHRLALGFDDTPDAAFNTSHKSLENLLEDIKGR